MCNRNAGKRLDLQIQWIIRNKKKKKIIQFLMFLLNSFQKETNKTSDKRTEKKNLPCRQSSTFDKQ